MWERQRPTGLGARATADMGEGWFDPSINSGLTNHGRLVRLAHDVGLDSLVLSHHGERTRKPQSQMPAIAQAGVGMTWQLESCLGMTFFLKLATIAVSDHLSQ